jgi:hypothetical protein
MLIQRVSPLTGEVNTMDLPVTEAQMAEYALPSDQRRYVQDIFPDLNGEQREFLMTGYTPADWTAMFGDEDGEE